MTSAKNRDLIDLIGDCLTEDEKAAYFREMMYCRSLPENDEMLRILRAMQFLTLLMEQVPGRVVIESERLEQLFTAALTSLISFSPIGVERLNMPRVAAKIPLSMSKRWSKVRISSLPVAALLQSLTSSFVKCI